MALAHTSIKVVFPSDRFTLSMNVSKENAAVRLNGRFISKELFEISHSPGCSRYLLFHEQVKTGSVIDVYNREKTKVRCVRFGLIFSV